MPDATAMLLAAGGVEDRYALTPAAAERAVTVLAEALAAARLAAGLADEPTDPAPSIPPSSTAQETRAWFAEWLPDDVQLEEKAIHAACFRVQLYAIDYGVELDRIGLAVVKTAFARWKKAAFAHADSVPITARKDAERVAWIPPGSHRCVVVYVKP